MITVYDVKGSDGSFVRCKDTYDARRMEDFYRIYRRARAVTITPTQVDKLNEHQRVYVWLPHFGYPANTENQFFNLESVNDSTVYDLVVMGKKTYGKFDYAGVTILVERWTHCGNYWDTIDPDQFS